MKNFIVGLVIIFIIGIVFKMFSAGSKARRNEMRTCQWCKQKIPYTAKVCPYCRNNPGIDFGAERSMTVKLIRTLIGIFILIFFVCICY